MERIILIFTVLVLCSNAAQAKFFSDIGGLNSGVDDTDLSVSGAMQKIEGNLVPADKVQNGLKVVPLIVVDSGVSYKLIGVFSGVWVSGVNAAPHRDAIGVQGNVFKNSADNRAVGLKCGVYDYLPGGSSTCLVVDFPMPQPGTPTVGISMEAPSFASGLVGLSFAKNPHAYKYATDYAGAPIAMGSKAGSVYCIQFNEVTANLEYIKNCGTSSEQVVGTITIVP